MPDSTAADVGHRIYEVRRARGPDARHEMPQRAFAELLNQTALTLGLQEGDWSRYDSSVIARLETGQRKASLLDVQIIALVDPERRGKLWLAWNETLDSTMAQPQPRHGPSIIKEPPEEIFDQPIPRRRKPGEKRA